MTNATTSRIVLPMALLAVLLGVSSVVVAAPGPASKFKVRGTFDIPKKEYRVGETVRGTFTVLNRERTMKMDIQKSEKGKLVYLKRNVKVKKGGRLTVPVVRNVDGPGSFVIQYTVNGTWPTGKGAIAGFSRTFDYVVNEGQRREQVIERSPPLVFVPEEPDGASASAGTRCGSIDCLIELARVCGRGEFTYRVDMPFPFSSGATVRSRGSYVITGKDTTGKCTFTSRSRGATVTLSQQGRADARARGLTDVEIDAQTNTINDSMNSEEATKSVTTCTGATSDVAAFFEKTRQGSADSSCAIRLGAKETRCTVEPNLSCVIRLP